MLAHPTTLAQASSDVERAKQIIIEIVRCSGGKVECKTKLYKIFYFAHLIYAKDNPGYLSDWPIVRMPHGPGIGDSARLISELVQDGCLEIRQKPKGPYTAFEYRLATSLMPTISPEAIEAIRRAVEFVGMQSAAELSELTHVFSNSWKNAADGEQLNIYMDLLAEDEYESRRIRVSESLADLRAVAG